MEFDTSLTAPEATTPAEVLKEIKEKVDTLYSLKEASDKAEKEYKAAKNALAALLEEAGVDKMQGDKCNVSLTLKTSCSVPKELDKKMDLFEYIAAGEVGYKAANDLTTILHKYPVLTTMLTINARSFSSWHDQEIEAKIKETGDVEYKLAMLSPFDYYSLGIRKRAAKK